MAASATGIRAGQAYVELLADDRQLQAGLAAAQKRLAAWGEQIRHVGLAVFAAGAGMLAPLLAAAKQFAGAGDALAKLSTRTGLSVELLSELKHGAELSGASLEDLEHASRSLSNTLVEALKGGKGAIDTLGGVDLVKRLKPLTQDQRFLAVARAIGMIAEPARRAAAATAVFGRSGTALLPLIAELDELRAEARTLGATMTGEQAQAAAALQDAWERLAGGVARLSTTIGTALAPALTRLLGDLLPVVTAVQQWIVQHQDAVLAAAKLGAILAGVGAALIGFSALVTSAAWTVRSLGTSLGVVSGILGAAGAVVRVAGTAWSVVTADILATTVAMRAIAAAGGIGATGLAGTRSAVLALALAFGRLQLSAVLALRGLPDLLTRIRGAAAAARIGGVTVRGAAGPMRLSLPQKGRADVAAGMQAAGRAAVAVGSALRSSLAALVGLPARVGGAVTGMAARSVAAFRAIRAAVAGLQVVGSLMGSLLVSTVARGVQAIPATMAAAWSAAGTATASGVGMVARAVGSLPGLAAGAGRALVAGIGGAFAALPTLIFGAIGLATTAIQAVPGLVVGAFRGLRAALAALPGLISAAFSVLPALVSLALDPVVLLGAAIVGLGIYLAQTTGNGTQALSALGRAFAEVQDDAVTAFGAIAEALSAGDIRGAVQVLWAFIQLEWTRGVAAVENLMRALGAGVAKAFLHVGFGINTAFWTVVYGIGNAIDSVIAGILKAFSTVIGTIAAKVATLLELVHAVDRGTSEKIRGLSQGFNAGVDQRAKERTAERDRQLGAFKALWDEKVADVNQWMASGMQAHDEDIAAKRAALDQAIADAKQARIGGKAPADQNPADQPAPAGEAAGDMGALSRQLAERLNTIQLKVDTLGTFNPAALGELGVGGTAAERGLQAQEKTARFTERIMNAVEAGGAVFE